MKNKDELRKYHSSQLITLTDALVKRRLVLVIGAGVSLDAGLPSWNELTKPLQEELALPVDAEDNRLVDPLYIAEMYANGFGFTRLFEKISEKIGKYTEPSAVQQKIAALNVHQIFTINYDLLLERACERNNIHYAAINRDSEYPAYLQKDDLCRIIKLHGSINTPDDMIITRTSLLTYEKKHPNFVGAFKEALCTNNVFFLGVSLKDINIEHLYLNTLANLPDKTPRHYIITKDWNPALLSMYERYALKAIPLDSWDELPIFLDILTEEAEVKRKEKNIISQTGNIVLSQPPQVLINAAQRHYQEKYEALQNRFIAGARDTLIKELEELIDDIQKIDGEYFRTLEGWLWLLLAQIPINRVNADINEANTYLDKAKKVGNSQTIEFIRVVSSIIALSRGARKEAEQELELVKENTKALENAKRIRFIIKNEEGRLDSSDIEQATQWALQDNYWWYLLALYNTSQQHFAEMEQCLTQFLAAEKLDAVDYIQAAGLKGKHAVWIEEQFCLQHHIPRQINLFFKHNQLINKTLITEECRLLVKAAKEYQKLGEYQLEKKALESACNHFVFFDRPDNEYAEWISRLKEIAPESQYVIMPDIQSRTGLKGINNDRFANILKANAHDLNFLWLITDWGIANNNLEQAKAFFIEWEKDIHSLDEKIAWHFAYILLYLYFQDIKNAGELSNNLILTVEFSYISTLFQIFVLLNQTGSQDKAVIMLAEVKQQFPEHPEVLAFSCEYWTKQKDWSKLEEDAQILVKLAATTQTYSYYLNALGSQEKCLHFLDVIEEAEKKEIPLPDEIHYKNKAWALLRLNREEKALDLFEKALKLNIPLKPQEHIAIAELYYRFGRRQEAIAYLKKLWEEQPAPEICIIQARFTTESDPDEAFRLLDEGKRQFPDHELLLSEYIRIGYTTNHGELASLALRYFTEHFPDSKYLRSYHIADMVEMLNASQEQAQRALA